MSKFEMVSGILMLLYIGWNAYDIYRLESRIEKLEKEK